MMIDNNKNDIYNLLTELQENIVKKVEVFKEDINKSFKEIQEKTKNQVKEVNKNIQYLIVEIDKMKKSQRHTTLDMENPGK